MTSIYCVKPTVLGSECLKSAPHVQRWIIPTTSLESQLWLRRWTDGAFNLLILTCKKLVFFLFWHLLCVKIVSHCSRTPPVWLSFPVCFLACSAWSFDFFSVLTAWGVPMCGSQPVVVLEKCWFHYLDFNLGKYCFFLIFILCFQGQSVIRTSLRPPESPTSRAFPCPLQSQPASFPNHWGGLHPTGQSPIIFLASYSLCYSNSFLTRLVSL